MCEREKDKDKEKERVCRHANLTYYTFLHFTNADMYKGGELFVRACVCEFVCVKKSEVLCVMEYADMLTLLTIRKKCLLSLLFRLLM